MNEDGTWSAGRWLRGYPLSRLAGRRRHLLCPGNGSAAGLSGADPLGGPPGGTPQRLADLLQPLRLGTRQEAIVRSFEGDPLLLQLAFGPFVPVQT
jgi:hypothetical protein